MESTQPTLVREHLEREHKRFAQIRELEILKRRARLAQAHLELDELTHLELDELTGELTPDAQDALRHELVVLIEKIKKHLAGGA